MKTNRTTSIPECSRPRWPFQRHSTTWLPTFTLCLLGYLPPAAADPNPNPNYPKDANVSVGASVTFLVSASSTSPPLTYQWQHEGTNVPASATNLLILTNVTVADAGGYVAWVTNASGSFTNSRTAILTVDTTFTKITQGPIATDREPTCGPAWGDYDNDGRLDLFVPNRSTTVRNTLYRNLGGDEFVRVTNALTLTSPASTWGAQWGDVDNDGDLDMLILRPFRPGLTPARNEMFRNDGGGVFVPMTNAATTVAGLWTDVTWVDHDRDGWVDLFATTESFAAGQSLDDFLWRNLSDGRFVALTTNDVGVVLKPQAQTAGPAWCDIDWDGDLDLYVSKYQGVTNFLYRNDDGRLIPVTAGSLPARRSTWAATWADFNNDGLFDLFTGGENGTNMLHLNRGNWVFEDVTVASGLALIGTLYTASAGDFDNDGDVDLYVPVYDAPDVLYVNRGDGTFDRGNVGSPLTEGFQNGSMWVDYNNDGFLDLFVPCGDGTPFQNFLYRNSLKEYGNTNHWLTLRLKGTASNASAIGARVRARTIIGGKDTLQVQQVTSGCLTAVATDGMRVHFGLGDATNVDLVRIEWPSGNVQELANVTPNQIITVTEATLITPARPSASLNGSVTLTRAVVSGATYQWRFDGVDLVGQTSRSLNLTNIVAGQEGRYSVVVSNVTTLVTNFVYLHVDTQFTKITQGAVVNDLGYSYVPAWGDYNGDGWLDLSVANGGNEGPTVPFLYRNDQQGGFVRVTAAEVGTLATNPVQSAQGIWADYDNDGDQDLFIGSQAGSNRLYANEGNGGFTRVTQDVGINRTLLPWGSAWADYDNDGLIDLYLASGWLSSGTRDSLWRNLGDGTFRQSLGITFRSMDVYFGTWGDADNDGDLDLLVGNVFYRNNGDGTFTDDPSAGLGIGGGVQPLWADFNNDGWLDIFLTRNNCYYFQNKKDGTFQRITTGPHTQTPGIIATAGDFDNDGDLDLFITRGQNSADPCLLLRNEGDGTFVSITCGSLTLDRGNFTGCAWADYDNDGALDLVVTTVANQKNSLFHNNGNSNGWLIVRPVGTRSNRDGVGAKVRATAMVGGRSTLQTRQIGGGALGDPRAHFGLGDATKVTSLRIEWPSGAVQEIPNVAVNQVLTVYEPPAISAAVRADGACELTIKAEHNRVWQIQASSDLLTWQTLTTVTNASYQFQFTDPAAPGMICRFYRLQSQ